MTQRALVIAANRLPVTRTDDGWEASPGGLVRALFPLLRESGGTWVGWTGVPDDDAEPFEIDGVHLHPGDAVGRRRRGVLRRLLERHVVAAVPRRDP